MRADDLGMSEAVNYGIYKSICDGVISCTGLMPNMEAAQHGYDLLKTMDICIGQHTNISLGKPICDPLKIPTLVNDEGLFYSSSEINHRSTDTIDIQECELEIEAQLHRFLEITGKYPDYFEGHAVFSKNYFQALGNVAKRYHLFFVNPMDKNWADKYHVIGMPFFMRDKNGMYDPYDYFKKNIEFIRNHDCTIAIFHPGYLDQYLLKHSSYTLIRTIECEFLCSQWLKELFNQYQIQVVDFRNFDKEVKF